MSHGKIQAAARKRMAGTGGSYAGARREVIAEFRAAGNGTPDGFIAAVQRWLRGS